MEWLVCALMIDGPAAAAPAQVALIAAESASAASMVDVDRMDGDLAYAVQTVERLAASIAAQPAEARVPWVAAAGELATNCPYNRATFMVILTLDRELSRLSPSALTADERRRFDLLARGVRAHADLLRTLGADELPPPLPGDYLYGDYLSGPRPFTNGATFASAPDPIAESQRVLELVPDLVGAMPTSTHRRIDAAWGVLGGALGHPETSFRALGRWEREFQALAPALGREASDDRVDRLSRLVIRHADSRC